MMDALELGGSTSLRAEWVSRSALLELALKYSQERRTFGKPMSEHQVIQFKLADMATQSKRPAC